MARFESDALALLVVRLATDRPGEGDFYWHPWDEAVGAEPDGLDAEVADSPGRLAPFKRFPDGASPYFSAPVERVLFPPSDRGGGRWVCCPEGLYLDIDHPRKSGQTARIELLERLAMPNGLGGSLGLIHLSLCPGEEDVAETLSWNSALRTTYLKASNPLTFRFRHGEREADLDRPVRGLVEKLFGDPHEDLERHLYAMTMATYPAAVGENPEMQREWRRALAKRSYKLAPSQSEDRDQQREREERQTIRMTDMTGLVLGNCTVFTGPRPIDGHFARNFRSYWSESLVFGLLQQGCLERFQRQIVEVDDPQGPSIKDLHQDWFSFCRQVWRSRPSTVAEPPQELLALIRQARGTEQLFAELEEDFASYSQHQHRDAEGKQAALVNLQIYGVPAVVLGTLATVIGLLRVSGLILALLLVAALAAAIGSFFFVKKQLDHE